MIPLRVGCTAALLEPLCGMCTESFGWRTRGFITAFKQMSVRRYLCILRRNDHLQILTGIPDGSLMQVSQSHEQLVFFSVFDSL